MKKYLSLLLMLLPLAFLASCDSDDQFPQVELTATLSGVTQVDDVYYAVAGEPVTIDAVTCRPLIDNATALSGVDYYVNYRLLGYAPAAPFTATFTPEQAGGYLLQMYTTILQVDKSITSACITVKIVAVASAADIPTGARTANSATVRTVVSPDRRPQ